MKHLKYFLTFLTLVMVLSLVVIPAAAQTGTPTDFPLNTITVSGTGSASGAPDIANMEIGVESINRDVSVAFAETNSKIEAVINALVEVGIAREDIRTVGLNIYQDRFGQPPMPFSEPMTSTTDEPSGPQPTYIVSNQVRVTIRDISLVGDAVNAAVESGANNIYGLNFGIDDRAELESEARADAIEDARARAEQLAELIGAELGEALVVNEGFTGGFPMLASFDFGSGMGLGGGAPVEPGQLSVNIQVQVTYRINR